MVDEQKPKKDTWIYEGTEFHRCPNCKKGIPVEWESHEKCGWNITIEQAIQKQAKEDYVQQEIFDAREINIQKNIEVRNVRIARSVALEAVARLHQGTQATADYIIEKSKRFQKYIETGE